MLKLDEYVDAYDRFLFLAENFYLSLIERQHFKNKRHLF